MIMITSPLITASINCNMKGITSNYHLTLDSGVTYIACMSSRSCIENFPEKTLEIRFENR